MDQPTTYGTSNEYCQVQMEVAYKRMTIDCIVVTSEMSSSIQLGSEWVRGMNLLTAPNELCYIPDLKGDLIKLPVKLQEHHHKSVQADTKEIGSRRIPAPLRLEIDRITTAHRRVPRPLTITVDTAAARPQMPPPSSPKEDETETDFSPGPDGFDSDDENDNTAPSALSDETQFDSSSCRTNTPSHEHEMNAFSVCSDKSYGEADDEMDIEGIEMETSNQNLSEGRELAQQNLSRDDNRPITRNHSKAIAWFLEELRSNHNAEYFRGPVDKLWPEIANNYKEMIAKPVDIGTMIKKLKGNDYSSLSDLKAEVRLLYSNAREFNGAEDRVTIAAREVRDEIFKVLGE